MNRPLRCGVMAILALSALSCRPRSTEVVVFHATSVTQVLGDAAEAFQREHPSVRVRLEPSGSQVAARKVAELGMSADLVLVADAAILDRVLVPEHAPFALTIATGEIVIAHKDHSRFTDEISAENWTDVVLRPGVRLGRADPDTAPIGYHTLLVWQLAGAQHAPPLPDLPTQLRARAGAEVVHDEAELLALLESAAIDYAFLYRSTAEDHHLKITSLPSTQNLSSLDKASTYGSAELDVRMRLGSEAVHIRGAPITYGLTVPARAPHPVEASQLVAFLLSERGRRLFERRGFRPVAPARCQPCTGVPAELSVLVSSER